MPDIALLYGGAAGDVLTDAASSASGVVFEIAPRALCSLPSNVDVAYFHAVRALTEWGHACSSYSAVPLESAF